MIVLLLNLLLYLLLVHALVLKSLELNPYLLEMIDFLLKVNISLPQISDLILEAVSLKYDVGEVQLEFRLGLNRFS